MTKSKKSKTTQKDDKPRCDLCSSTRKMLAKTPCCDNWICNDENDYVMFSYARNSCARNHRRFTLCGYHHNEEHKGDWKTCKKCLDSFELEMYVWYSANEYNFTKLENPPKYEPTHCRKCNEIIILSDDGYSSLCGAYYCGNCEITEKEREQIIKEYKNKKDI